MIPGICWGKGTGKGPGNGGGGQDLTLHLLSEAVHIISLIGVSDAIGPHAWELILVSIAAFPRGVDGVPVRNPEWASGDRREQKGPVVCALVSSSHVGGNSDSWTHLPVSALDTHTIYFYTFSCTSLR